jgi:hypothetical protein
MSVAPVYAEPIQWRYTKNTEAHGMAVTDLGIRLDLKEVLFRWKKTQTKKNRDARCKKKKKAQSLTNTWHITAAADGNGDLTEYETTGTVERNLVSTLHAWLPRFSACHSLFNLKGKKKKFLHD